MPDLLRVQQLRQNSLSNRLKILEADYLAIDSQLNSVLDAQSKNQLQRRQKYLLQEMTQIEEELNCLGVSTEAIERNKKQEKIILDILEQIDFTILKKVYMNCCPDGWLNAVPSNKLGIWNNLKDMPSDSGKYNKVALFVVQLLKEVNTEQVEKLKKFAQTNIVDFFDCLNNYQIVQTTKQETCILVWIHRSSKPKKYFISAFFIIDVQNYEPQNNDPQQVCKPLELEFINQREFTLNDIEELLEKFCQATKKYTNDYSETPWIEFFVDADLLNKPIDCWKPTKKDKSKIAVTLGCKYTVFTRSSKRLSNHAERPRWVRKWQTIQQQNLSFMDFTFASECSSLNQLYVILQRNESCVLIIDRCYQKQEYTKIISTIEDTGTPIVLWIRENKEILSHQIEIRELIRDSISELPNAIRQKRSDAFGISDDDLDKKHIGNHLTLLWENPYLYPIELKYSSPK